jgi:hypothetical protein
LASEFGSAVERWHNRRVISVRSSQSDNEAHSHICSSPWIDHRGLRKKKWKNDHDGLQCPMNEMWKCAMLRVPNNAWSSGCLRILRFLTDRLMRCRLFFAVSF